MKNILLFGTFIVIISIAFYVYSVSVTYKPSDLAINSLLNEKLDISNENDYISFVNKETKKDKGFLIYPGGYVDPVSYSPICNELALKGYTCIIAKMPLNLAIFGVNKGEKIIKYFPYITNWYFGGHSLGGPMVSRLVSNIKSVNLKGVFFLASYSDVNLSELNLSCISITGSEDNVLDKTKFEANKNNLPKDCQNYEIKGGNHSQFGSYGLQKGDNEAKITFERQLFELVDELDSL